MGYAGRPRIGGWYRRLDRPQAFQVVAIDERGQTVDVEYFDGTVDEWPLSHWHGLEIEACEAPQDWSGPFDDVDSDDPEGAPAGDGRHELLEGVDAEARKGATPSIRLRKRRRNGHARRA